MFRRTVRAVLSAVAVALSACAVDAREVPKTFESKLIADLVKELKGGSSRFPGHPYMWGSGSSGDVSAARLLAVGKPAVPALLKAIREGNGWQKVFAMEILAREKCREAIPNMIHVLASDKELGVRGVAAGSLGDLKAKEALPELLKAASRPGKGAWQELARSAVEALGQIGDASAVPVLVSRLGVESVSHHGMRYADPAAANALAALGDPGIAPLVKAVEGSDKNAEESAWGALATMRGPRAVSALLGILEKHPSWASAAFALADMGDRRSIPILRTIVNGNDLDEAAEAAKKLSLLGYSEAAHDIRALAARTDPEKDYISRIDVLEALCTLKDRESALLLIAELKAGGDSMRIGEYSQAAAEMLGPDAIAPLVAALTKAQYPSWFAPALAKLGKPAVAAVVDAYRAGRLSEKATGSVMAEFADPKLLSAAMGLLAKPKGDAMDGLLRALSKVPMPEARPTLVRLLKHIDPDVRLHAAQALARLGDVSAASVLIEDITLKQREIQDSAKAFKWIGKAAVPALEEAIARTAPQRRDGLVHALTATAAPEAANALVGEVGNNRSKYRICAIRGLRAIGTPNAIKQVQIHAESPDLDVRWEVYLTYVPGAGTRLPEAKAQGW